MSTKTIQSPYPPEETLLRIEGSFDGPLRWPMSLSFGGRILGRVDGDRFTMIVKGPARYAPKAYFVGQVLPHGAGSIIVAGLDLRPSNILDAVMYGFLGLVFLPIGLIATVTSFPQNPSVVLFVLVPLLMMAFLALMSRAVRRAQEADAREIEAALMVALAKPSPVGTHPVEPIW